MTNYFLIASIYEAFSGDTTPTAEEMYPYLQLSEDFGSAVATAKIIEDGPIGSTLFGEAMSNADKVTTVFQGLFGREPAQAGLDYWVDQLENNSAYVNENSMAQAILRGAEVNEDQTDWNNVLAAASDLADELAAYTPDGGEEPSVPGEEFVLTSGTDRGADFEGTENNDSYEAPIVQNPWAGGVSNSLSSADVLDGKGGTDSLHAELVPEFFGVTGDNQMDVQPRTTDIENVTFEARESGSIGFADDGSVVTASNTVVVDAKYMTGVDEIGSKFSDGDLVIENLTTLTDNGTIRNTADMTITMDHTDNFNSDEDASDLTVYFDEDYLVTGESTSGATLTVRMLNAVQNEAGNNPIEGFSSIAFKVGDEDVLVDITSVANDPAQDFTTAYTAIVALINAQLNTQGITTVTATAPALEDAVFSIPVAGFATGDDAGDYYPIILTNTGAEALTGVEIGQSALSYDTDMNSSFSTVAPETSDEPLSVQVELEKVGREGEGGNLVIGGKSQDADEGEGIPIFNIDVLGDDSKPSNLGTIRSTNGALDVVNIATADATLESFASLTVRGESDFDFDGSALPVDGSEDYTPFGGALTTLNAVEFLGDLTIGNEVRADDIASFTATGGGVVTLYIDNDATANTVTTGTAGDYLNITDAGTLTVNSGGGDDELIIQVGGATITSNQINAGSGNDELAITGTTATVDMGAGDDVVNNNSVALDVSGGTGNDIIYVENTGDKAVFNYGTSALVASIDAEDSATSDGVANPVEFFQGVRVQVTVAVDGVAADESTNGYESDFITIDAASGNLTTLADINAAILSAVNDDPVLSKIVEAEVVGNDVVFTYLVDGVQVDNAIDIEFFAPATALTGTTLETAIETEWEATFHDSDEFSPAGENNTAAAEQTAAIAAANGIGIINGTFSAAAVSNAVYTLDLTGVSTTNGGTDTITLDGVLLHTDSNTGGDNAAAIAGAIDGNTITLSDGIVYDIDATDPTAVTFTARTAADNTLGGTVALAGTGGSTVPGGTVATVTTAGEDGFIDAYGTDTNTGVANTVNGNEGDDVIVLSSDTGVSDTLVFTGYNQGNDTVVHFESGVDQLDLSAYLNNMMSLSGSVESQINVPEAPTTGVGKVLEANSVSMYQFNADFAGLLDTDADTVEFDDLTAAELEAAMEDAAAGFTTAVFAGPNGETLVGTVAKSIVIIHNDEQNTATNPAGTLTANDGEYKIFEVTYTDENNAAAGDANFTVQLIGTVDMSDDVDGSLGLVVGDVIG